MNEATKLTREELQRYIDLVGLYFEREVSTLPLDTQEEDGFVFREISEYNSNPYYVLYLSDYDIHVKIEFTPNGVYYELERNDGYIEKTHPYTDNHEARLNFLFRIIREFINMRDMMWKFSDKKTPIQDKIKTILD
jgi:hypothetical protein